MAWTIHPGYLPDHLLLQQAQEHPHDHFSRKELKLRNISQIKTTTPIQIPPTPTGQFLFLQQYGEKGRIPLPARGSEFWAHHKYSVMARGYNYYKEIQGFRKIDLPITQAEDLIQRVSKTMELPITEKALANTLDHLWGYFKTLAQPGEREEYKSHQNKLDLLYSLARKYQRTYLLHSTIFADNTPGIKCP